MLTACGGRTIGNAELAGDSDSSVEFIAPIRELYEFPGTISGFVPVNGRFLLSSQEVCFNFEQGTLDETVESPLNVNFANERLTTTAFFVESDEELGIDSYCFNPIVGEGVYTIDIELILNGNTELYAFNFNSNLPNPFRLIQYPQEFVGLRLMTREEREQLPETVPPSVRYQMAIDDQLCVPVGDEDVIGGIIRENVTIALDGRLLDDTQFTYTLDDSEGLFCLNDTPDAGVHSLYILVNAVASTPITRLAFQGEFVVLETE